MDELKTMLQTLFNTKNEATFTVAGPGSVGMDACVLNMVEPGDKILVARNGVFGMRISEVASRGGAVVVPLDFEWGTPVDPQAVEEALKADRDIKFVAFHHEQGAGHAAVGAARTNNRLSVCNVTAGCGVTNAMTSLLNAWEESAPVLFLSGNTGMANQAKYINQDKGIKIRKYGIQDLDVLQTVAHLCKTAVAIEDAAQVPYELDRAIWEAQNGRPGPVWIDIPGNIQSAQIPENYPRFVADDERSFDLLPYQEALKVLSEAQRPVIVAGNGINLGIITKIIILYK
jgi:thiamine pyrophosphate-dependent acetolactate synthase large subunit-like protein